MFPSSDEWEDILQSACKVRDCIQSINGTLAKLQCVLASQSQTQALTRDVTEYARRGLHFVNEIIALSGMRRGALKAKTTPFRLSGRMDEVIAVAAADVDSSKVSLGFEMPQDVEVHSDPELLQLLLVSLLSDALQLIPSGSLRVIVHPQFSSEEVFFTVAGSASGESVGMPLNHVPEQKLDTISNATVLQEDSYLCTQGSLTHTISEALGAKLCFPQAASRGPLVQVSLRSTLHAIQPPQALHKRQVVIVDPIIDERSFLFLHCEALGMEVSTCSGIHAVSAISPSSSSSPDILLCTALALQAANGAVPPPPCPWALVASQHKHSVPPWPLGWPSPRFHLHSPVQQSELEAQLLAVWTAPLKCYSTPVPPSSPRYSDMKVLVMADRTIDRDVLVGLLKRLGCLVDTLRTQKEFALASAKAYDVIFLDLDSQSQHAWGFQSPDPLKRNIINFICDAQPSACMVTVATGGSNAKCTPAEECPIDATDHLEKPVRFHCLSQLMKKCHRCRSQDLLGERQPSTTIALPQGSFRRGALHCRARPAPIDALEPSLPAEPPCQSSGVRTFNRSPRSLPRGLGHQDVIPSADVMPDGLACSSTCYSQMQCTVDTLEGILIGQSVDSVLLSGIYSTVHDGDGTAQSSSIADPFELGSRTSSSLLSPRPPVSPPSDKLRKVPSVRKVPDSSSSSTSPVSPQRGGSTSTRLRALFPHLPLSASSTEWEQ